MTSVRGVEKFMGLKEGLYARQTQFTVYFWPSFCYLDFIFPHLALESFTSSKVWKWVLTMVMQNFLIQIPQVGQRAMTSSSHLARFDWSCVCVMKTSACIHVNNEDIHSWSPWSSWLPPCQTCHSTGDTVAQRSLPVRWLWAPCTHTPSLPRPQSRSVGK